jgi:ABC-type uncharacterized transport system permease subunit
MERMRRAFNRFAERHADLFGQILLMGVAVGLGFFAGLAAGHYVAMHFARWRACPFSYLVDLFTSLLVAWLSC